MTLEEIHEHLTGMEDLVRRSHVEYLLTPCDCSVCGETKEDEDEVIFYLKGTSEMLHPFCLHICEQCAWGIEDEEELKQTIGCIKMRL